MTQMKPTEGSTGVRARVSLVVLFVVALTGGLLGCTPPQQQLPETQWGETASGAWMTKRATVAVGEPAPMPEEAGVAGVQPAVPGEITPADVDFVLFGQRLNLAAEGNGVTEQRVESFTLVYNQPFLAFGTQINGQDWHTLVGGIDYVSGTILYADIEFAALEHEQLPEPVYDVWLDSLEALVFAATPELELSDAGSLLLQIGVTQDGAQEGEYVLEANGLEYRYTVDARRERLRITGAE